MGLSGGGGGRDAGASVSDRRTTARVAYGEEGRDAS